MSRVLGVLALQGAFAKHIQAFKALGVCAAEVRSAGDLEKCQGLVLPGGESTTILKHMVEADLVEPVREFAKKASLFGTCAGIILMAGPLQLFDVEVERNGYGRQKDSFITHLSSFDEFPACFIRAPRIRRILSPAVKVLATHQDEPVLIQQGRHLGATFHPELTNDLRIHNYFVQVAFSGEVT